MELSRSKVCHECVSFACCTSEWLRTCCRPVLLLYSKRRSACQLQRVRWLHLQEAPHHSVHQHPHPGWKPQEMASQVVGKSACYEWLSYVRWYLKYKSVWLPTVGVTLKNLLQLQRTLLTVINSCTLFCLYYIQWSFNEKEVTVTTG